MNESEATPQVTAGDLIRQVEQLQAAVTQQQRTLLATREGQAKAAALTGSSDLLRLLLSLRESAVDLERDQDAQQKELRRLRALRDVSAAVNSSLDLDDVLETVMDAIIRLTRAERAMLLRFDDQGELQVSVARNLDQETLDSEASAEISRSVVRHVATTGEPVVTLNAQEDDRFAGMHSIVSYKLRSILCVPLITKGTITGVIYADNRIASGLFGDADRDMLASFANQAAVAIENARLFHEVAEVKALMDNVFASIGSGVITVDPGERVALFNRAAERMLNARAEGVLMQPYGAALESLRLPITALVREVQADGRVQTAELDMATAGRPATTLQLTLSPLRDARDEVTGGVAVVIDDVSEKKRVESLRRYLPPALVDRVRDLDAAQRPQRRLLTVLFADIRNFSTYGQTLDPEELIQLANGFFSVAVGAISDQQGLIDKFVGDAVMALFNTPLNPLDDHVDRAVAAALEIRGRMSRRQATLPIDRRLHFGIGIHTGEAVVGNVGGSTRKDYSAIGDVVNLAKRLQEIAAFDQILASGVVAERVGSWVNARPLSPVSIKGRETPEQVYELSAAGA